MPAFVLGNAIAFLGVLYGWYLFYLGVPTLKKCPQDKALGYTLLVLLCGILLGIVLGSIILSMVLGGGMSIAAIGMPN